MLKSVLMSWSGGKDSCMALHELQKKNEHCVAALLTTVTNDYDRISMHGVRRRLLEQQTAALGLPLHEVLINKSATNDEYESKLIEACSSYQVRGIYPVWLRNTSEHLKDFIALGFKAVITCVNAEVLDSSFAGVIIDDRFLSTLPSHVDPCGENGEFHTFVFDGPNFQWPVKFTLGEKVRRDSFWFRDLLPA